MDVTKFKKEELYSVSETISKENIKELIDNLLSPNDKIRYHSFLILQYRSEMNSDVFSYWDNFVKMLDNNNSYHRSIGINLISTNTRWDKENKIYDIIDKYLSFCDDEKLVTARYCIQGLSNILIFQNYDTNLCKKIINKLIGINMKERPSTNLKVMTTDIVNILMQIQKEIHFKEIVTYLSKCLEEEIIDKKLKKEIKELLN